MTEKLTIWDSNVSGACPKCDGKMLLPEKGISGDDNLMEPSKDQMPKCGECGYTPMMKGWTATKEKGIISYLNDKVKEFWSDQEIE